MKKDLEKKHFFTRKTVTSSAGRLDRVLRKEASGDLSFLTRSSWKRAFKNSWILGENGKILSPGLQVPENFTLILKFPVPRLGLFPSQKSIEAPIFISPNKKFMVFSKEAELHSYPNFPWEKDCFSNRLSYFLEKEAYISSKDFEQLGPPPSLEGGLLQRLDKGTGGIISVALSAEEKERYRSYFSQKRIVKHYLAIVHGRTKKRRSKISLRFSQKLENQVEVYSMDSGKGEKVAELEIRTLDSSEHFSLMELITRDGLRHQLRASLKFLSLPILGDTLYAKAEGSQYKKLAKLPHMQQLHAWKLLLPKKEGGILVKIPPPSSFQKVLSSLGLAYAF